LIDTSRDLTFRFTSNNSADELGRNSNLPKQQGDNEMSENLPPNEDPGTIDPPNYQDEGSTSLSPSEEETLANDPGTIDPPN
jgi:hypothetical protein